MPVLYARLEDDLHAEVKEVARLAGISARQLAEVVLAQKMGHDHALSSAVDKAFRKYRAEARKGQS